jgi:hypothetical protein
MSEFKFACPVCGQHMMCDASQGGSVMDCPTCFQKIVAPQAPAADVKFILTGTKLAEKKAFAPGLDQAVRVEKKFPAGLVLGLLAVVLVAGAAGFYFHQKKISAEKSLVEKQQAEALAAANAAQEKKEKIAVAPPANDANWSLALGTNALPATPVAGRIHGQDFICERASFQNGSLMLRAGTHGTVEFAAFVNFGGAPAESLSGQRINVTADTDKAAKISLRWKDASGTVQKENLDNGYAMRLEFGALANNRLPGKIWLCTPDKEKSYLLGSFNADARKPKPKSPKK